MGEIMAINYQPLSKLTASDFGSFDLGAAIKSGLDNAKAFQEARYRPRNLENEAYGKELSNKINAGKAKYAEQQSLADLQSTQTNTSNVAQQIKQKRADMERMNALRKYLSGGGSMPESGGKSDNGSWSPGHMTPHGFEGSIAPTNPDNFYANTGEDRQAEQEAVDRIDSANNNQSFIPSAPSFGQKIKQGMQQNNNKPGSSELERANYLWDNVPSSRKDLKAMGFERDKEHPYEKMEREIATSTAKEQTKINLKRAQQISEAAKDLSLAGMDINGIHDLLTGPDSLGTGITKSLMGKFGWGSEKLGAFNERALRLQTQMTKALSSRGGVGAANIVASGKPTTWKSTSENLGITEAYAERIKNEFDLLNKEYKGLTGKELPYTLPEYVHNIGKKMEDSKANSSGKTDIVIEYVKDANGKYVPKKQGAE